MDQHIKQETSIFHTTNVASPRTMVRYQDGAVVSREVVHTPTGTVTIFAFDQGQGLSEHAAPYDALIHVLEGDADVTIGDITHRVSAGEMVLLPARQPHSLKAVTRFQMILTMLQS